MKTPRSPLATMTKPRQRRRLHRDVQQWQRSGRRIQQLPSGTARGLCPVDFADLETLCGYSHEL